MNRREFLRACGALPFVGLSAVVAEPKDFVFDGHWHEYNPNRRPPLPKTKWRDYNDCMNEHNPIFDDVLWKMI